MSFIFRLCTVNKQARDLLLNCIDNFVSDGVSSFYDLPHIDQSEVVGLLLKALDTDCLFDCIVEHKDSDTFVHKFAQALITQDEDARRNVFETLQANAISYYSEKLDEHFQQRINEHDREANETYYRANHHLLNPEYIYATDNKR